VLAVGLLVVAVGGPRGGRRGRHRFVPAVVDLLLPTEALVPPVGVVLGYRALLSDGASGNSR